MSDLNVKVFDASLEMPKDGRTYADVWHTLWAMVFGRRVPTSHERAHIDGLMLTYRPDLEGDAWKGTDARRVYKLGNLLIYDYRGDAEMEVYTEELNRPRPDAGNGNEALLEDNKRQLLYPVRMG